MNTNIKHAIRDIVTVLFTMTGTPLWYRRRLQKNGPLVRVLAYHDVPDREAFERQVRFMRKHFHLVTPQEFQNGVFNRQKVNILLTFDDGYATWFTNVAPVLKKYDLGGIFFVTTALLDVAGDEKQENDFCQNNLRISPRKILSWGQLKTMTQENPRHEIGSHTVSHPNLHQIDTALIKQELKESKDTIEKYLNRPVISFAYPFGVLKTHVSDKIADLVKQIGYQQAFTTHISFVPQPRQLFLIPRTCIDPDAPLWRLRLWVAGSYDLLKNGFSHAVSLARSR